MSGSDFEMLLPRLRRFARCLLCERELADDVVCESLEEVFESRRGVSLTLVETELLLFRAVIDGGRKHSAGTARAAGATEIDDSGETVDPMRRAVVQLSFDERAVIGLHVLEGFSLDDTAHMIGDSRAHAREHLDNARTRLAHLVKMMEKLGAANPDASGSRAFIC